MFGYKSYWPWLSFKVTGVQESKKNSAPIISKSFQFEWNLVYCWDLLVWWTSDPFYPVHYPQRRNVTTLMVWLKKNKKKRSHTQKSHPKMVNPRDIPFINQGREPYTCDFVLKNKQTNKQTKNALTCAGIQTFTDWYLSNLIWWERWLSSTFLTNLSIDMDEIHYVATTIGLW